MGRVKSPYNNAYERLVGEHGEEGARQIMAERRAKVDPKNIKGGPFRDPKFAVAAAKLPRKKRSKPIGSEAEG